MRLFMCHDYGPNGRDIQWETTVGDEIDHNIHVGHGTDEDTFVKPCAKRAMRPSPCPADHPVACRSTCAPGSCRPRMMSGKTFLKVPMNGL
jgi:hypothetical protein